MWMRPTPPVLSQECSPALTQRSGVPIHPRAYEHSGMVTATQFAHTQSSQHNIPEGRGDSLEERHAEFNLLRLTTGLLRTF